MEGKNVILLFTKDQKTYMLNADEFAQTDISNTTTPTFKMTDMTEQLKSSEDLSRLLNI
jgi:exopolysaccharide biosynthesis predicted pyruvyltransferase EpsI